MQKVDIAIGVMGAVALLATGLGVAFYDDINDLTHYHVETGERTISGGGALTGNSGSFDVSVPDNTFHAMVDIDLTWSSQNPSLSGAVDVTITITGPDGSTSDGSGSFDWSDGSGTVSISSAAWATPPGEFDGGPEDLDDKSISWDQPMTVEITITGPSSPIPVPQAQPAYTADIGGMFHVFSFVSDTPDPETA